MSVAVSPREPLTKYFLLRKTTVGWLVNKLQTHTEKHVHTHAHRKLDSISSISILHPNLICPSLRVPQIPRHVTVPRPRTAPRSRRSPPCSPGPPVNAKATRTAASLACSSGFTYSNCHSTNNRRQLQLAFDNTTYCAVRRGSHACPAAPSALNLRLRKVYSHRQACFPTAHAV